MSQRPAMDSLFSDDPFFSQERLLWPLHQGALSSLQQDFFNRRTKLAGGLMKELHDGAHMLDLHQGAFPHALFASLGGSGDPRLEARCAPETASAQDSRPGPLASTGPTTPTPTPTPTTTPGAAGVAKDLLVTLDVRGYAPEDIHVKLEGRRLAVVAARRAAAEASDESSSSAGASRQRSSACAQAGFSQSIELPAHLDLAALRCTLTEDGRLRVDAPVARRPIAACGEAERKGQLQQQQQQQQQQQEVKAVKAVKRVKEEVEEQGEEPARFRSALEFPVTKDN
ncbi:heat shock protein beta-9 isoform X2 [Gadus macrocephalus]|uniref:heat shock protein beta-9 isoform X2 n=1 Tax=Gadus macrocephalus TaxID=80720 RepID=UPI0028CB153F|nr:heat shock protein beta-9 isoform X2 [Gadus macrocephalus]